MARLGRLPKTEHERRNKPADSSLTPAFREHLQGCATSAGVRFTDYVRQIVLKADFKDCPGTSRLRSSPGQSGKRLTVWLTLAEREDVHSKATALGVTLADYIHRALLQHSGYEADENVLRLPITPAHAKRLSQKAAAAKLPLADFILKAPLEDRPPAPGANDEVILLLDGLLKEMNAIGVNVNQLAHKANAGKVLPGMWETTAIELKEKAKRADQVLQKVALSYGA